MSTIKSSNEHLTLNADGSSKDIKFQANGVEKASISSAGAFTSTTIDATKLTGNLPAINGASLTNLPSATADGFFATSGLSSKDLGQGLHIKTGDSGLSSINSNFSQLVVEGNTTAGMSILTSTTHEGVLAFSDSGGHRGLVRYAHANDALSLATADVDRLTIDSTGAVTMPHQPAFHAQLSNKQTDLATGTWIQIPFNVEIFDQNSDFNTSTHFFTAPVTGRYQLQIQIRYEDVSNSANYLFTSIETSNRAYYDIFDPTSEFSSQSNYHSTSIVVLADMDANDTAKCETYQSAGSTSRDIDQGSSTVFSGFLVC